MCLDSRSLLDVSRLSADWQDELGRQAKSAGYSLDGRGRRVVDPKDKLKEKLGRSPDSCDEFSLSYYVANSPGAGPFQLLDIPSPQWESGDLHLTSGSALASL